MPKTVILVPARLASTRFPRKLLHPVHGKPLLLWVAERLREVCMGIPVHFAVDDASLSELLGAHGFSWIMTSPDHASGTDRLAEANRTIKAETVLNVQADEPLVAREHIGLLSRLMENGAPMGTLAIPFRNQADFDNPNQVKVVMDKQGHALYFSRAPIPRPRDEPDRLSSEWFESHAAYRHLGLYAYTADFLETYTRLPQGRLESIEKLEQLRVLENGYKIAVGVTKTPSLGIDTPEDAAEFEKQVAT